MPHWASRRWLIPLLVIAIVATYGNTLSNGFHYDDYHSLVENPNIRDLSNIPAFFIDPGLFSSAPERAMYRPLLLVTYALNYELHGYELAGYHLVNIALHLGCTLVVYWLSISLGCSSFVAGGVALLFGIHPVNAEVVNYISSRSESLAAFWYLLAFLLFVRWRTGKRQRVAYAVASLAAYVLAVMSKATTIVFPLAVMLFDVLRFDSNGVRRFPWKEHVGYWVVTGLYIVAAYRGIGSAIGDPVRAWHHQAYTQIKAIPYYLQLVVTPAQLSVEHGFLVSESIKNGAVLSAVLLLCTIGFTLRRSPRAILVCGCTLLPLLPASVVPLNVLVNEHRLYLPLASVAVGTAVLLSRSLVFGWKQMAVIALAAITLGLISANRNQAWENELTLWRDAADKAPFMYRSQMHLGGALEESGDIERAMTRYRKAAELAPEVAEVHYNRANIFRRLGRVEEAVQSYRRSLEIAPGFHNSLINLSAVMFDQNRLRETERLLEQALSQHPSSGEVHRRLGVLYARIGRSGEALKAYNKAISLRPDVGETYYNLANLHWTEGKLGEAERQYERALSRDRNHLGAAMNLGVLYLKSGRYQAAHQLFWLSLAKSPDDPGLLFGVAQAHDGLGKVSDAIASYRKFLRVSVGNKNQEKYARERLELLASQPR